MTPCLVCREARVEVLLDLGPQPITNRFPLDEKEAEHLHPMRFGACRACGAAQLLAPPPAADLKPRVDWITYNEPEPHLDGLADRLAKLPEIGDSTMAVGVSGKDDSLLRRLRERGVPQTRILDAEDLGDSDRRAFVETIQALLTPRRAAEVAARRGAADLVIARHIFEHAGDPASFTRALFALAKPGGLIVLEAPDCTRSMAARDYTMLWEEHSLYLNPAVFRRAVELAGGEIVLEENHPYALENSIVLVARAGAPKPSAAADSARAFADAKAYADAFARSKIELRAWLDQASKLGKIAMFGAGHLGAVWLNAMGVADKIAFVIDDNPNKRGRRMPGSRLPILGSDALLGGGVAWALMAFSPDAEDKVMGKNAAFSDKGGRFASIFPGSPNSFTLARR